MNDDILRTQRERIIKEDNKNLPWVPKSLDKTWEVQAGLVAALAGLTGGLILGMHIGIASGGTAIAGTIPLAITGAILGYLSGAKIGTQIHSKYNFDDPSTLSYIEIAGEQQKAISDE